jgi:ABC-type spermidine/putrescine transport system permease subunit II
MEAARSSETLVTIYQLTRRNIPRPPVYALVVVVVVVVLLLLLLLKWGACYE